MSLVLPIFVEQSFVMLMGIVNSVMASHIGKTAVSAIGLVDSMNNLVISFFSALAVGATVVVAHYIVRKEPKMANETVKQALYSSLGLVLLVVALLLVFRKPLVSILFGGAEPDVMSQTEAYLMWSSISYPFIAITGIVNGVMRGASDSRTPMKVTLIMNLANVVFGYLFIYGIRIGGFQFGAWGIHGAGAAICAARALGAGLALYAVLRGTRGVRLEKPFSFAFSSPIQKSVFGIGLPASIENVLFNLGKVFTQSFIVAAGTAHLAANYLTGPISNMLNLPGLAISLACSTLVGQAMGADDRPKAKQLMWDLSLLAMSSAGVLSLILFPLADKFLLIYQPAQDVMPLAVLYVRLACVFTPLFWAGAFILPGGLRSAGDGKFCLVISVASLWAVRVGFGYVLSVTFGLGAVGVWLSMFIDWVVRAGIYAVRVRGNKWGHRSIIHEM